MHTAYFKAFVTRRVYRDREATWNAVGEPAEVIPRAPAAVPRFDPEPAIATRGTVDLGAAGRHEDERPLVCRSLQA